ncbi:hypothetical protein SUGI_0322210 [Cryptomeria japonica]|uniref:transcription factor MYB20 n=1 Tax=Cryptomeria japonica TaxID=3369 RepID=UPI002408AD9B|nr:transcription factor MYB20 [Cryptomeria japonica]GLJ18212.1 hypothetical protein SUGI_0322210 [Cryptomeria japonica]
MGRRPCCDKVGLKKGPWTADEDKKLVAFITNNGHCCWRLLPKLAGLLRCGKSCRLRWTNYLRPDLKRGVLSESEENLIIELHSQMGNRWSKIASHLPGRTDNEIKNYWNTHIKKKLWRMGIDPVTHRPLPQPPSTLEPNNIAEAYKFSSDEDTQKQILHENPTQIIQEPEGSETTVLINLSEDEEFKQREDISYTEIPCKMEDPSIQNLWDYNDTAADCFGSSQYGITWFDHESYVGQVFETPGLSPASPDFYNTHLILQSLDNFNNQSPSWDVNPELTSNRIYSQN